MPRRRVQYRAVVRFSVFDPSWTGWRASRDGTFATAQDYRAWLWGAPRMEQRLDLFSRYAAPLYQLMAERHDFRVLVQHSEDLDEPWLGQLRELSTTYPVLRLHPVQTLIESRDAVERDLSDGGRTGTVVMLRVDDDDLLSVDFLDMLEPHVGSEHRGWCVSLGQGLAARVQNGQLTDFRALHFPFTSVGQAYVGAYRRWGRRLSLPPLVSHRRASQTYCTVVDSRSTAFVQVRGITQDTRAGLDEARAARAVVKELERLPRAMPDEALRAKFPTLATVFDRHERSVAREVVERSRG